MYRSSEELKRELKVDTTIRRESTKRFEGFNFWGRLIIEKILNDSEDESYVDSIGCDRFDKGGAGAGA